MQMSNKIGLINILLKYCTIFALIINNIVVCDGQHFICTMHAICWAAGHIANLSIFIKRAHIHTQNNLKISQTESCVIIIIFNWIRDNDRFGWMVWLNILAFVDFHAALNMRVKRCLWPIYFTVFTIVNILYSD